MNQSYSQQAIIGGQEGPTPYAALVSSSGTLLPITTGAVGNGAILSVAINDTGFAIIGGRDNGNATAFAALISPSGISTLIATGAVGNGNIPSVDINSMGNAIIGGRDNGNTTPFAALISPSGISTPIVTGAVGNGALFGAAINDSGNAIIGGRDNGNTTPFAALISASGVSTPIATGAVGNGNIQKVGINSAGNGIIAGSDNGTSTPFAALISSSGSSTPIATGAVGFGNLFSAAINESGNAIIGGTENGNTTPFAALISSSGTSTPIPTNAVGIGAILSVAINDTGSAIIGGLDNGNTDAFAALISSSGTLTPIVTGAVGEGEIDGVAINNTGAAIIGGFENGSDQFAALISPSGVSTRLFPPSGTSTPQAVGAAGLITSVALENVLESVLESVVPKSFGPDGAYANSLFALSAQVLSNHLMGKKPFCNNSPYNQDFGPYQEIGLLASSETMLVEPCCCQDLNYVIWAAPFGVYAHQKKQGHIPALTDWIGGALVAFDYLCIPNTVLGGGVAYAYNDVQLSKKSGSATINQEFLTLYGSWICENFYFDLALWSGYYQMKNKRNTPIEHIKSKSHVKGWLLSPHLEISFPMCPSSACFMIDPFVMLDWANNWQGCVREKGSSGFNLRIKSQYTSLLRTEAGIRFFQNFQCDCGTLILEEKGSWVNKSPFHAGKAQTFFVGGVSSFGIEIFSDKTQNLGAVQLNATFFPCCLSYPYGSINYQGEFGSPFQSHLISFEIGKFF